jgi:hypothetical protein
MSKEKNHQGQENAPYPDLDPTMVSEFAATFLSRGDYYPRQKDTGAYFVVEKPLHVGVVMAHLRSVMTIGAYALSPDSTAKYLAFDADTTETWSALKHIVQALSD